MQNNGIFTEILPFIPSMITKQPKSGFVQTLKKGGKALLIFEGALLLGSYGIWRCMNTSQDFRYRMHQHFPSILETYYVVGETLSGNNQLRTFDYTTWSEERNEH
ncbi:hypothetical protein DMN91_000959 [Ooceraea biroi]|uniref:Uncharacterized protein n=1 Tax=Ooceraea biroi TaxID=2015173 RepID=A0A3L8E343_OOCBI|nr:hypothetical protein DMN91_000959 [Ooceraea biroi]